MGHIKRSALPTGPFHVIAHAVGREPLFRSDADYTLYIGLLQRATEACGWRVWAFVLMSNHVHLLVWATAAQLTRGLYLLDWPYAEAVHDRHPHTRGHVFERRPDTLPILDEAYLYAVIRYIARNPVRHGACARPEHHRWNSHRALIGAAPPIPFIDQAGLLEFFGGSRERYAAFVDGTPTPEFTRVVRWAEGAGAVDPSELARVVGNGSDHDALRAAYQRYGYTYREIADVLGVHPSTVMRRLADQPK